MAENIKNADFQDALNINEGKIVVNGEEWGYVTGVTLDGKSPEDLINCIGGTLRRRKPRTTEWSVDSVIMYGNLDRLKALEEGQLFNIVLDFTNPDTTNPENLGQTVTIQDCRVQNHTSNFTEGSTFRMDGRAKDWSVTVK